MHAHGDALMMATMSGREGSGRGHAGAFRNAVANLRTTEGHDPTSREGSVHGGHGHAVAHQALDRQASLAATLAAATANSARPRGQRHDSALRIPHRSSARLSGSLLCS